MNIESTPQDAGPWRPHMHGSSPAQAAGSDEETSSLEEVLGKMKSEIRAMVPDRIEVEIGGTAEESLPKIALSREQAQDLIRHLVIDAVDAMPGNGMLTIMVAPIMPGVGYPQAPSDLAPGSWVMLSVCESRVIESEAGRSADPGQPPSLLDKGRALGLSAAYEALARAGGSFTVARRARETAMHIYFPAVESALPT